VRIVLMIALLAAFGISKEYKLVFSESTPPYVFKDGSGIVQTIVKEALAYKGHTVSPVFVNIGRGFELFKHGYVDGSTIIQKSSGLKAYYSIDYMQYHNAVFALKKNHYAIKKLDDLKDYHLIGFQNAAKYLGERFGKTALSMGKRYSELADQKQQVYMLFRGRTDIVAMDRHIFKFYRNELIREGRSTPKSRLTSLNCSSRPNTKRRSKIKNRETISTRGSCISKKRVGTIRFTAITVKNISR
jgi:polar amino acid transport system substrate-binding protein